MADCDAVAPPRGGKGPKRPFTYSEDVNEAPEALDAEPVEVEESRPADQRVSVQAETKDDEETPPLFEE